MMENLGASSAQSVAMIVHPDIAGFEREILRLRVTLSEAIRTLTYMQEVEGPYLRVLYVQQLGEIQVEVMELQAEVAVLRRQIDGIRARLNRGEIVTAEWLNDLRAEITGAMQELLDEILRRKNECREVEEGPREFEKIDRVREVKLKAIYRELCRALHPDMGLGDGAIFEVWWDEIQSAYACGDLEQLESIALALDIGCDGVDSSEGGGGFSVGDGNRDVRGGGGDSGAGQGVNGGVARGSLEVLGREKERLRDCLRGYLDKIEGLKVQPPFSYGEMIRNPLVMEEKHQDYCEQKKVLVERKVQLEEYMGDLLTAFSIEEKLHSNRGTDV